MIVVKSSRIIIIKHGICPVRINIKYNPAPLKEALTNLTFKAFINVEVHIVNHK